MKYASDFARRVRAPLLAAACWLATGVSALAQQPGAEGGRGATPWVLPYALVLLGVGLGLLVVCKPSRRRERAKIEQ